MSWRTAQANEDDDPREMKITNDPTMAAGPGISRVGKGGQIILVLSIGGIPWPGEDGFDAFEAFAA